MIAHTLVAALAALSPHAAGPEPTSRTSAGLVPWHASFEEACDAASESGRPVLLFQLMGRLDDRFC